MEAPHNMEIEGKLHVKFDTQQVSDKFMKRDFVVEYSDNPSYPQYVTFQLTQDRCSTLDGFQPGDKIQVTFNLRGREWKSPQGEIKYFNTLEAWKVSKLVAQSIPANMSPIGAPAAVTTLGADDSDDMPF